MKLGLKRGDHLYSTFIRYWLKSQFSHAALEINGRIYESVFLKGKQPKAGVRDYPLSSQIAAEYVWIDLGSEGESEALSRYEQVRGYPYDLISELSFLPIINVRDSKRMYCYELVLWMLGGYSKWRVTIEIILMHIVRK